MPRTPDYFADKTIVITGAGSGIGRATALIFGREGTNVLCADIDGDAARDTAEQVIAAGARALATTTDVSECAAVQAMVAAAMASFGAVDFCSIPPVPRSRARFLDIDDDLWKRSYDLNVNGVFYAMQAALPHMLELGHPSTPRRRDMQ